MKVRVNGITAAEIKQNPKHKKNAEIGHKNIPYGSMIYIEQKDAVSLVDDEEACIFVRLL